MISALKLTATTLCLAGSMAAQRPPIIDRDLIFGDPEISGAQISPDGKYVAFLKPWNKTRNIWVKATAEPQMIRIKTAIGRTLLNLVSSLS